MSETVLARHEDSLKRRGLTELYSTTLEAPEYVARHLEVSAYGWPTPPFAIKGDAVTFAPTSRKDHLASGFFDVRARADPTSGACAIILELDWATEDGRHPTVLLQSTEFDTLACIADGASEATWVSPAMPVDSCPERLRV